jgi:hypothetical protein
MCDAIIKRPPRYQMIKAKDGWKLFPLRYDFFPLLKRQFDEGENEVIALYNSPALTCLII